ncbi:hypothetical protein CCZ08_15115 [Escherichia coli]|nr:hypothetical protein CCZ11_14170 [Escherichia coli]RAY05664.1 hypothetical protein CCZ08_15115 [Escherichia coli]
MTRSLELRVCIAHKSIPAPVGQGMKYCCRMALYAEAQRHRVCRLLTKSALFMRMRRKRLIRPTKSCKLNTLQSFRRPDKRSASGSFAFAISLVWL